MEVHVEVALRAQLTRNGIISFFLAVFGQCTTSHYKRGLSQCYCPTCALTNNGLPANTLTRTSLNPLSWSTLTLNGLNLELASNTTNTTIVKEIMPFLVSCALNATSTWTSIFEDGLSVQWAGELGLAPGLASNFMNQQEQGWVSGCLLARVNYFGKHIELSLRNTPEIIIDDSIELTDYPVFEGAFFGNLFSNDAFLNYACQGEPEAQALLESPDRKWRICTDSDNPCNMIVLGSCNDVCQNYTVNAGYSNCVAEGQTYNQIINVFLQKYDSAGSSLFLSLAMILAVFCHLW